jgi:hypothetical protein
MSVNVFFLKIEVFYFSVLVSPLAGERRTNKRRFPTVSPPGFLAPNGGFAGGRIIVASQDVQERSCIMLLCY